MTEVGLALMHDVLAHPHEGVAARYRRLGMSGERGHAAKERLVREGWLEAETVPVARTRLVLLRPTARARQELGLAPGGVPTRESLAHDYWKHRYAAKYRALGYRVRVEAPHAHGRADVLAVKDGESIAIEIETGKGGQIVQNVRNGLRSGFGVLVVATDGRTADRASADLAQAGLLVPGKVRVTMAL